MKKHNLRWDIFPGRWENGPFIGNGLTGSIIYASPDSTHVKWYLGRSDIGKLDFPGGGNIPIRIQIGSINLETAGKILFDESSAELDIWNAEARGIIRTTAGEIKWRSFTPLNESAIVVELYEIQGDESKCRWATKFNWEGNQKLIDGVETYTVEDRQHHPRSEVASGGHTIAWIEDNRDSTRRLYISLGSSPVTKKIWDNSSRRNLTSIEDAILSIENVRIKDWEGLLAENRNWWHAFYKKSFLSVPRLDLESYYWIQLYKMASSSREEYPMIDNHGIWSVEPAYGFATWDLNVQSIYRLHLKSNHVDLGVPLIRFMDGSFNEETMWNEEHGELRAGMKQQTFLRYRFFDTEYWEHPEDQPVDGPGKFLWGCHNYWMQYRYSMDTVLLKNLLPKLEGGINAMTARLQRGGDGKLHIPTGRNWENWIGEDPTGLLAVLDWALSKAILIGNQLEYDEEKISRWDSLKTNLATFPTGEYPNGKTGFLLGRKFHRLVQGTFHYNETPLPHRHWSHLLMIFPLHTLTWDQVNQRELIKNSIDYWSFIASGLNGQEPTAGYAPCASMNLYASIGQTEKIPNLIDIFLYRRSSKSKTGTNVWASTMYRESGPVIETPLLFAATIQEFLLQSYNGIIKVFPAVPDDWNDAAFYNYRAEGGILISAKYKNKSTEFIRIESLAGEDFILETTMGSVKIRAGNETKINKVSESRYEIKLPKGNSLLMYNETANPDFIVGPVEYHSGKENSYGLNKHFLEKREFMKDLFFEGY
jgi:hypothetical protein